MKYKIKEYIINFVLLLISISLVLIIFEAYLRYNSIHIYDEQLGFKVKPNLVTDKGDILIKTNSDGLRDREYGEKANNTFRILLLGDSFTFDVGNDLKDSYGRLLERKLNSYNTNIKFEVVNAGVFGYDTIQELDLFMRLRKKYNPDLVLVQFYINDVSQNYENFKKKYEKSISDRIKLIRFVRGIIKLLFLQNEFQISNSLIEVIPRNFLSKQYSDKEIIGWEVTEKILLEMRNQAESQKKKIAIIIIPQWGQIFLNYTYAINKSFLTSSIKDFIKFEMNNMEKYNLNKPNEILKNFGNENNVTIIDPLPEFKRLSIKNENLYLLPINEHLNRKGNQVVADIIYKELLENLLVPVKN